MEKRKSKTEQDDKNLYPPNCYKVGDSWVVDFTFRGERYRESLGCVSRTVAKETAARKKTKAADGKLLVNGKRWNGSEWVSETLKPKIQDPLFSSVLEQWLAWSKATRDQNTWHTDTHNAKPLRAFFGQKRLSEISPFLVDKYRIERRQSCECPNVGRSKVKTCPICSKRVKSLSDATINHELVILKSLFKKASEWRMTQHDPTELVKLAKLSNARVRYLTEAEAGRLLSACNEDFRDVVLTAMHTGLRSNEIKTLRWSSVDMVRRSVTVLASNAKNKDLKCVPMSDDLYEMFQRLKSERNRKPEDVVFISRYGKPWKSWRTAFENARERAALTDFRFHDLRHCFASWLAMNGTTKKGMMELLGHRDPKMTDRYTHLSDDYRRQAVQSLPKFRDLVGKSPQKSPQEEKPVLVKIAK
jgi:integrase